MKQERVLTMKTKRLGNVATILVFASVIAMAGAGAALADTHDFPSNDSTVTASVGVINENEIGWFLSASMGHKVTEVFADGEAEIERAILDIEVPQNTLTGTPVEWEVLINGVTIGDFQVLPGFLGSIHKDMLFDPISASGGEYEVALVVTNDVPFMGGAHTLAYAGPYDHSIQLIPEPATLSLLVLSGLCLLRRRRNMN